MLISGNIMLSLVFIIGSVTSSYFAQLSDIHYDEYYMTGSPATCLGEGTGLGCCREYDEPVEPYRQAGYLGDVNCDSPYQLIEKSLKYLAGFDLDFILWTGDSASHHLLTQTMRQNMRAVETVTNLINQTGLQVYPSVGNHDTWPIDQLPPPDENGTEVSRELAEFWGDWLNKGLDKRATEQLSYGGYYDILVSDNLRLMSLNTLYFEIGNLLDQTDNAGYQWEWMESTLALARENEEKVWIIGHIFPSATGSTPDYTQRFQELVSEYSDIIKANFWGHTHKDQFILYRDNNQQVVNHGYVVPSFVPNHWYTSMRVYEYDTSSYEILNYYQLSSNVNVSDYNYDLYYDALKDYEMKDLSTESWNRLAGEMIVDDKLFDKYYEHYYNGNPKNPPTKEDKLLLLEQIRV